MAGCRCCMRLLRSCLPRLLPERTPCLHWPLRLPCSCEGSPFAGDVAGEWRENPHVQSYVLATDRVGEGGRVWGSRAAAWPSSVGPQAGARADSRPPSRAAPPLTARSPIIARSAWACGWPTATCLPAGGPCGTSSGTASSAPAWRCSTRVRLQGRACVLPRCSPHACASPPASCCPPRPLISRTPSPQHAGYTLDSLMLRYQGVDWRDRANWACNAK